MAGCLKAIDNVVGSGLIEDKKELGDLEGDLLEVVFGQDDAVKIVANAIKLSVTQSRKVFECNFDTLQLT